MGYTTKLISAGVVMTMAISISGFAPTSAYASSSSDSAAGFEQASESYTEHDAQEVADLALAAVEYMRDSDFTDASLEQDALLAKQDNAVLTPANSENSQQVGDELIYTDVDNGVDMMYRSYDGGEQIVAILGSEEAPTRQVYDLELPESAELELLPDGSINIYARVLETVSLPGEDERIERDVERVLGADHVTFEGLENLTDAQIDALVEIPDASTMQQTVRQLIGTIKKPWAIDATGEELETYFQTDGARVTQVVATNEGTQFPVVADPNIVWWVKQASTCLAGVATLATFGPAKVATVSAKAYKVLKAGKTAKLRTALANWNYLGKTNSARFSTLVKHVKNFAKNIVSTKGNFKLAWTRMSSTKAGDQAKKFMVNAGTTVIDIIGLRTCYNIYKEIS